MNKPPASRTLTRSQRKGVALVTLGFILCSAVIHFIIGGSIPPFRVPAAPAPSVTEMTLAKLETPPPTPPPPASRPNPTPMPTQERATPRPLARATLSQHLPPERAVLVDIPKNPAANATAEGDAAPPALLPATPEPSSPPDYSYVIVSARFINQVHPRYPDDAMRQGEEGTVIILLTVGPAGAGDVRIWASSGYPELDQAAMFAAKESTYSIPEVNGQPATETYRVIYTFTINSL